MAVIVLTGMDAFECPGERLEIDTTDFATVHPESIVAQIEKLLEQGAILFTPS